MTSALASLRGFNPMFPLGVIPQVSTDISIWKTHHHFQCSPSKTELFTFSPASSPSTHTLNSISVHIPFSQAGFPHHFHLFLKPRWAQTLINSSPSLIWPHFTISKTITATQIFIISLDSLLNNLPALHIFPLELLTRQSQSNLPQTQFWWHHKSL